MASLTSSFFCSSPMSLACQGSGGSRAPSHCLSYSQIPPTVVCQSKADVEEQKSVKVHRRSLAMSTAFAAVADFYSTKEAKAAKRKPAAPEGKKLQEDKDLSAYDAKLLANYRRKEAMKEALEKQKARGKAIGTAPSPEPKPMAVSKLEESVTPPTAGPPSTQEGTQEGVAPLQVLEAATLDGE